VIGNGEIAGQYKAEIVPRLKEKFGYRNVMQVPRLSKVVVNMGLGDAIENVKVIETAAAEIGIITGQKPVVTKARKSIANFKFGKGFPSGSWSRFGGTGCTTFSTS